MQEQRTESLMIDFQQLNKDEPQSALYSAGVAAIAAFYSVTVAAGMLSVSDVEFPYIPAVLISCMFSLVLNLTWTHRKTAYFRLAAVTVPVAVALILSSTLRNGIALICNAVLNVVGAAEYKILMPFAVTCSEGDFSNCIAATCCIAVPLLALLCTHLLRDNNCPAVLLALAGQVAVNLMYGNAESWMWLSGSVVCTVAVITKTFLEEKNIGQDRQMITIKGVLLCLGIMIVLASVTMTAGKTLDYKIPRPLQQLTAGLEKKIDVARYGDPRQQVMPSGDFSKLGNLKFTDTVMLEVTADKHESLYLRGFVGGSYNGDGWENVDGTVLYENADTFYWIHKDGMFGQSMIASAAQVLDEKTAGDEFALSVKVKGADRHYYYTPYEMTGLTSNGEMVLDDTLLEESSIMGRGWNGAEQYEITTLKNQVKRFPSLVSELEEFYDSDKYRQYLIDESHYNAFVYDTYTSLPDGTEKLLEKHLSRYSADIGEGDSHLNYTLAKAIILDYMNSEITYSEAVPKRSESEEFMKALLESDKTGYSVHYATAATLMFRYYGIPARYVEGYLITPDKVKRAKDGSTLPITGRDAHAWVEYYQDGIGWIPFETTPLYMDIMEQPETDTALGDSGSSGQAAGMEMSGDNYEKEDPEKEEDERKPIPWDKIVGWTGLLLAAALIITLLVHLIKRKRRLNELKRSFEMEDNNGAVINLYVYILTLQSVLKAEENGLIYAVYQKAAFSADKISQQEKQQVVEYRDQILERILKECKLTKRFVYRWIKGIY